MNARPLRTLTRLTFANPASLVYLAVVGVTLVVAASEPLDPDASGAMIWVWPAMLTLPAYVPIAALGAAVMGESMPGLFVGSIVLAALVQSLGPAALFESPRARPARPGNLRA
ncbi:SCO4225 family membrane protein [Streptomyces sp. NPDC054837]